ncbi:MAG: hypothetical protein KR126chlam1_00151 [Chlamydiae bacterium]|nr:hypothetical protein [Chlamydiota bacterium]
MVIARKMKEDPTFKKRFGISTTIKYTGDVLIDPKCQKSYDRAWKKFQSEMEQCGSWYRRKRFDAMLKKIEPLGDDLPFCKRVEIRYISKKVGHGVFAKENIAPYSILNHYAGIIRPDKEIDPDNDSAFTFSDFPKFTIDGKSAGNWVRFMNHSPERDPKTNVVPWEHYSKWGPRIIFTACHRGIKKGAQLLYSYGETYWEEGSFLDL